MNPRTVREPVILTVSEVAELAEKIEPNYRALVLIAAWCGLRWGEVIELRRKDIRLGCETISVSRAATHRGACRIDTPKSGKGRKVAVPPHIKGAIEAHLANYVAAEYPNRCCSQRNARHAISTTRCSCALRSNRR